MECVSVGADGAAIDCTEEPSKTNNVAWSMTNLSFMVFFIFALCINVTALNRFFSTLVNLVSTLTFVSVAS